MQGRFHCIAYSARKSSAHHNHHQDAEQKTRRKSRSIPQNIYPFVPLAATAAAADAVAPRPGDELVPSDRIPAKLVIQGLEFSPAGSSLLVWGESYVAVARARRSSSCSTANSNSQGSGNLTPARYGGNAEAGAGGGGVGKWKWTLVDMSGYAVDILRQKVVKASWHPASDDCLVLLTVGKEDVGWGGGGGGGGGHGSGGKGGAARAFVMLHVPGRERPEQVYIGDWGGGRGACNKNAQRCVARCCKRLCQ